jgi:hypothetical protein
MIDQLKNAIRDSNRHFGSIPTAAVLAIALALAVGCHKTPAQASQVTQDAGDPADANMAPVSGNYAGQPAQVLGQNAQYQPQQQGEDYGQQAAAPIERRDPNAQVYSDQGSAQDGPAYDDQQAQDAYSADLTDAEADQPPPPLPDYDQPPAPEPDYIWTPGYWGWGSGDYYWVPGYWVAPPYVGALWTPGYWGYVADHYRFHHGFWGLHIGFYGGVDYGYGYVGHGYYGGYWDQGHFRYNTAVNHVNVNVIHNVYTRNVMVNNVVVNNRIVNHVSYSGGRGGVAARPMPAEIAVLHEQRQAPMASQVQVQHEAAQNRGQFFSQNKGRPAVVVNSRPVVDHSMPAQLPRVNVPMQRPGAPNNAAPSPMQGRQTPNNAPQPARPNGPQPQPMDRPAVQGKAPVQGRPDAAQGASRQTYTQRGVPPQPPPQTALPNRHPQPEQQGRPQFQQRPQAKPQTQAVPQPAQRPQFQPRTPEQQRPQEQARPPQQQARPQEQQRPVQQPRPEQAARPAPEPAPRSAPAPAHMAPPPHAQTEARPAPEPHPQGNPHDDQAPRR